MKGEKKRHNDTKRTSTFSTKGFGARSFPKYPTQRRIQGDDFETLLLAKGAKGSAHRGVGVLDVHDHFTDFFYRVRPLGSFFEMILIQCQLGQMHCTVSRREAWGRAVAFILSTVSIVVFYDIPRKPKSLARLAAEVATDLKETHLAA